MLFDTHAHLTDDRYNEDRTDIINEIKNSGMLVLNCGWDEDSSYQSLLLADKYDFFYAAAGTHPHDSKNYGESSPDKLRGFLSNRKAAALGEIGLDYYYDNSPRDVQRRVFIDQLRIAGEMKKPAVIHSRDAAKDTFDILSEHASLENGIVLHSFSQSTEMLERYLKLSDNIFFSVSGPVTFKNAQPLRETAGRIPLDRLFVETDSPYLTPHPHRGKRNSPLYTEYVARELARIFDIEYEQLAEITAENAKKFFRIP